MKKQITLSVVTLLMIAGIATGCKKEEGAAKPLKKKIEGKWQLTKKETTTAGAATVTYTGVSTDYFQFRSETEDQVEAKIGADNYVGTYVALATDDLNIILSGKLLNCVVNNITDNVFEFTGTVSSSSPKVTEKYYLSR